MHNEDADRAVDELCDRFEAAWREGGAPLLEDFLEEVREADRSEALADLLRVEVELREARGESPVLEEYLRRFPDFADACQAVLGAYAHGGLLGEDAPTTPHKTPLNKEGRVFCPQCRTAVAVGAGSSRGGFSCPSCGSGFALLDDSEAEGDVAPLEQIGRFELIERVGMGSFGAVWKALDTRLDRVVALKVPRSGMLSHEESQMFLREARSAAQLRHPNIVPVFEVGQDDDSFYIVSEFIEGETLADRIRQSPPGFSDSAQLLATIARALQHAHEAGVVHRDLKPGNIMIDAAGEPFLMDFGLAKRETGEATMTQEGVVLGTPAYMSPEQARGDSRRADRTSDIYSLGVIMYQMLTGELPFGGPVAMLMHRVLHEPPERPRRLDERIPANLEAICLKCLQKQPEARYGTAGEVAEELGRFLSEEPIEASLDAVTAEDSLPRIWRWSAALALAVFATVAVVIYQAGWFGQQKEVVKEVGGGEGGTGSEADEKAKLSAVSPKVYVFGREGMAGFSLPPGDPYEEARPELRLGREAPPADRLQVSRMFFHLWGDPEAERNPPSTWVWLPVKGGPVAGVVVEQSASGDRLVTPTRDLKSGVYCLHSGGLHAVGDLVAPEYCAPFVVQGYGAPEVGAVSVTQQDHDFQCRATIANRGAGAFEDGYLVISLAREESGNLATVERHDFSSQPIPPQGTLMRKWNVDLSRHAPGQYRFEVQMLCNNLKDQNVLCEFSPEPFLWRGKTSNGEGTAEAKTREYAAQVALGKKPLTIRLVSLKCHEISDTVWREAEEKENASPRGDELKPGLEVDGKEAKLDLSGEKLRKFKEGTYVRRMVKDEVWNLRKLPAITFVDSVRFYADELDDGGWTPDLRVLDFRITSQMVEEGEISSKKKKFDGLYELVWEQVVEVGEAEGNRP